MIKIQLLLLVPCVLTASTEGPMCLEGQVMDLNNNCVKKFVLPKRKQCPGPVQPPFGSYRLELGGRMVQYSCENGWTVYGEARAFCKLGLWDPPEAPSCVRAGCDPLPSKSDVLAVEEMGGATVRFECDRDGYALEGSPVLTCDGQFWNGTVPACKEVRDTSALLLNQGAKLNSGLTALTLITFVLLKNYI